VTQNQHAHRCLQRYLVLGLVLAGFLYGVTYQQYRHFEITDPRGAGDALSYVKMAHGDYDVLPVHRTRFIVPALAGAAQWALGSFIEDENERVKLSFYLVNFTMSLATALLLHAVLTVMGFDTLWAFIGALVFICSRVTILVTATPLVDSLYFMAIALVCLLTLTKNTVALAVALPFVALVKETTWPFLLLPVLTDLRKAPVYWVGLVLAGATVVASGLFYPPTKTAPDLSLAVVVRQHVDLVGAHLSFLATLRGLHDLQNGFSVVLLFAAFGAYKNRGAQKIEIPAFLIAILPLVFCYALLSGNLGRMFFAAFPVIIPYALVGMRSLLGPAGSDDGVSARTAPEPRPAP